MRWTPGGTSSDIEDRRGMGIGGGIGVGAGGILLAVVISLATGGDFFSILRMVSGGSGGAAAPAASTADEQSRSRAEDPQVQFVSFVLDDAQRTWAQQFQSMGREYQRAKLVLFRDRVESGCGVAGAATGPFYCPGDQKVYIDLSFFDELARRFEAPGDFAQAYVLAHEVGHHVQTLLGISQRVHAAQGSRNANELSVRLELQADCFAGVWGNSASKRQHLEPGDVEEGMAAASAVGDDRIQRSARGTVNPETFTHGSSAQRVQWFRRGLDSGSFASCDTFAR